LAYTRLMDLGSHCGLVRSLGHGAVAPCQLLPLGTCSLSRLC
jgi:hypothetical protein